MIRWLYTRIQYLSLDVVAGAMASGGMSAWALGVRMPLTWWIALPLGVWAVYTADHLIDAFRLREMAHTERHLFHYHYFGPILTGWVIIVVGGGIYLLGSAPAALLQAGLAGGITSGLHFLLIRLAGGRTSRLLIKELGVGFIYTAGVWGSPGVLFPAAVSAGWWIAAGAFFLVVMFNLLLFSLFELTSDTLDGHTSFVRAIGARSARRLLWGLGVGMTLLAGWLVLTGVPAWTRTGSTLLLMGGVHMGLLATEGWSRQHNRYRYVGDAAFMLPGWIWIIAGQG
ncbi:MAG: hypothetical protein SF053_00105 [Bacteroidia bacterium]|nr:hypothetical protein [Bacteroidia bacterium]